MVNNIIVFFLHGNFDAVFNLVDVVEKMNDLVFLDYNKCVINKSVPKSWRMEKGI